MTRNALLGFALLAALAAPAAAGPETGTWPMPPFARGRIGLQVQPMTPELREHLKAPKDAGVLVVRVEAGKPAAAAGVRVGDVVTRAGGEAIDSPHDLIAGVASVPEGGKLALELVRAGRTLTVEVAPEGLPSSGHPVFERWPPGGFHHGIESLERRLEELERRLERLEEKLPPQRPT